jgi:glycosyltransferase involved in cell wall biosynthesis
LKKVLIIGFFFPPVGGAGTQRSSKFVKYLPHYGWQPTVIGGIEPNEHQDPTLLTDIPNNVQVHRFPIPSSVWRQTRHWLFRHRIGPIGLGRLGNYIGWFLDFPDTKREWADTAAEMALYLHKIEPFDVIYTTCPPYSVNVAVKNIHGELKLPWVVDFRDPWSTEDIELGHLPKWMRRRHAKAEKDTAINADAIVCATQGIQNFFINKYGIPEDRCPLITNGFDPDDLLGSIIKGKNIRRNFTITHTGTPYGIYSPDALAKALQQYWTGPPEGISNVELRFIGGVGQTVLSEHEGLRFTIKGRVDHPAAIIEQQSADMVLLTFDRRVYGKENLTSKLFEYLACGRPILAVIPADADAAAARIIRECSAGWIADCDKPEEIVSVMHHAISEVSKPGFHYEPDMEKIAHYSRPKLTKKLAAVFEQVSDQG